MCGCTGTLNWLLFVRKITSGESNGYLSENLNCKQNSSPE